MLHGSLHTVQAGKAAGRALPGNNKDKSLVVQDLKPVGSLPGESGTPLGRLGRLVAVEELHCSSAAPLASPGQWCPPAA